MAERLAVGTTVHGKMLHSLLCGNIFFPERRSTLAQHTAPVVADFLQYFVVVAHHAEGFQFVEAHIGSGDGLDVGIQHDALHDLLALLLV